MNSSDLSSGSTSSLNIPGQPEVKLRNGRRSLATANRRSDVFNIFRYSSVRLKVDLRKRRTRSEYIAAPTILTGPIIRLETQFTIDNRSTKTSGALKIKIYEPRFSP
ncbi:hypothetical protein ElyMa_003225200 [Elysia marginata]|uniref:C2 NT-type domain-containing protein n=1 Tax=Elysia marginata TaxID=1093978 RepID=A0AAV4J292_9GAST|nr:hypothetical protein ElyMa_003225200 [Elysia marginata]